MLRLSASTKTASSFLFRGTLATLLALGGWTIMALPPLRASAQSDLDDFMLRVLARRDENWKKLQQYVLDERQQADLLGPDRTRLFGVLREYTWYVREGYFVRSPTRYDGVTLTEQERRDYEDRWIASERRREEKGAEGESSPDSRPVDTGDVGDLLRNEPRFVSTAYFLRFKFERGRYALVGREVYDGRSVLRVEYYPERLFSDDEGSRKSENRREPADPEDAIARKMNKVALVTLWVEPEAHQIVQYTFENVGFDFLPGRWLVRVDDARATMRMGEPFPGVWLPAGIDARFSVTLANGAYELRYAVAYSDYRQADVTVKVR